VAVRDPSDLYGLPLEQFVPERAALAAELRRRGHRDQAKRIAALRKPSIAAWAVNQLVRTQPKALAELFAAGDELERAQQELLSGRGAPDELRAARMREGEIVEQLSMTASGLLSSEGSAPSQTTLGRISETLHAAALQAQAREAVHAGCLEHELRHIGLGSDSAMTAVPVVDPRPSRRARAGRSSSDAADASPPVTRHTGREPKLRQRTVDDRGARERIEQERQQQLANAREAEAHARRRVGETARSVEAAERRRDRAAEALRAAEAKLASARVEAETAQAAHRSEQQALEEAQGSARSRRATGGPCSRG